MSTMLRFQEAPAALVAEASSNCLGSWEHLLDYAMLLVPPSWATMGRNRWS
jgi:hypothetical protein